MTDKIVKLKELLAAEREHNPGLPALCDSSCGACDAAIDLRDLAVPLVLTVIQQHEALEEFPKADHSWEGREEWWYDHGLPALKLTTLNAVLAGDVVE